MKSENNDSTISQTITIRLSNEALEALEEAYERKGYGSVRAYIRAMVEHHTTDEGIFIELPDVAVEALAKRAKEKGWSNVQAYCTALLRSFALPDAPIKKDPTGPKKRSRK